MKETRSRAYANNNFYAIAGLLKFGYYLAYEQSSFPDGTLYDIEIDFCYSPILALPFLGLPSYA